jgi:hypothetical protein
MTPICVLFTMVQSITVIQYFAREKLDSLKDLTWGIFDAASAKKQRKREKKPCEVIIKDVVKEIEVKSPESLTNDCVLDKRRESSVETRSEKHLDEALTEEITETFSKPNEEQGSKSEKSSKGESGSNSPEKSNKKSLTTDQSSALSTSGEIDKEDLKELNKIFWRMRIARFFISDFVKIAILIISYIVRIRLHLII